jgi:hypothetical protein
MIAMIVKPPDAKRPHSTRENAMTRATLVLGAASLAISAGAASAQAVYPSNGYAPHGYGYTVLAPLYDYAGPASSAPVPATPHGYGPLIYAPQLFAPTPAFPAPPAEPGYYTAQSAVVSQPLYDYAPGYWGADIGGWPPVAAVPDLAESVAPRTTRHYGHRMYMMSVNRTHKGSKLTPASNADPRLKQ